MHTPGSSSTTPGVSFHYAYNSAGQRTAVTNVDGSRWSYAYDALGQVTSGKRSWSNGGTVAGQQFEYTFDDIGNRQTVLNGGNEWGSGLRLQSYTGNTVNQYSQRTVPAYVEVLNQASSNTFVTINNQRAFPQGPLADYFRTELSVNNNTGAVVLGITNIGVVQVPPSSPDFATTNLVQAFVPKTPELFGHDADGNLTNNGRWTFKWDAENRLIEMETGSAVPTTLKQKLVFGYDWQGRRVSKTISNWVSGAWQLINSSRWIWDGWRPLAEMELTNGALRGWYVWGLDESATMNGAGGVGGLLAVYKPQSPATNYFCVADGQGNVAGLMDFAGSAVERLEYGPFGEPLRGAGAPTALRWSSKYEDAETGLIYYGRRYYDPAMGRWLSRDPIGEKGGLNLYGFVGNDAIQGIDPLGLDDYQTRLRKQLEGSEYYPPSLEMQHRSFTRFPERYRNPDEVDVENFQTGQQARNNMADADPAARRTIDDFLAIKNTGLETVEAILELTPQNSAWVIGFGESLSGRKTDTGGRVFCAATVLSGAGPLGGKLIKVPGVLVKKLRGKTAAEIEAILKKECCISKKGVNNPTTRESAVIGQEAHRQLEVEGLDKWIPEQTLELPD